MEELEKIKSELKNDIQSMIQKGNEQVLESAKGFDEGLKTQLDNALAKFDEVSGKQDGIAKQLDALELASKRTNDSLSKTKSFGDYLSESMELKKSDLESMASRDLRKTKFYIDNGQDFIRNKTVATITLGNVTGALPTSISPTFVMPNERKVHVRSLLMNSRMTDATYSYPVFTDKEGTVGIQTEGSAKSKMDYNVEYKVETPIVIAALSTLSMQILRDVPRLQSYVTQRMVEQLLVKEDSEILSGAGGSNRLNGILTRASAYAPTGTANKVAKANRYSYLLNAAGQLAAGDYSPNGILINPFAYYEMLQVSTTTNEYTAPLAGITFLDNTLRIAGIPVYASTAMATEAFVIGDWSQAELLTRDALTVDISTENSDNFEKNLVTIRVEESIGLAVEKSAAFLSGSWTALVS